jgi:hypothetical protein
LAPENTVSANGAILCGVERLPSPKLENFLPCHLSVPTRWLGRGGPKRIRDTPTFVCNSYPDAPIILSLEQKIAC